MGALVPGCSGRNLDTVAVLLFVTFMLLVAIVYINLLVAMMTTGYDKVSVYGPFRRARAGTWTRLPSCCS